MPGIREVHVQPLVVAQEQIAEGGAAVLFAVMVIPGAAACHQGNVAVGKHVAQPQRACPGAHGLHAALVVGPAHLRSGQRHLFDVARLQ
ncbi:hypothetical protein G6F68_020384 [Rhizopus microsporus]|nr:hypothetical protein G6F68_020384 [Rhizopus microsporus]